MREVVERFAHERSAKIERKKEGVGCKYDSFKGASERIISGTLESAHQIVPRTHSSLALVWLS